METNKNSSGFHWVMIEILFLVYFVLRVDRQDGTQISVRGITNSGGLLAIYLAFLSRLDYTNKAICICCS